ncbi:MAG: hypothetical protein U0360_06510 [Dehalococcoidia bacterium]
MRRGDTTDIADIEGIGPAFAGKLKEAASRPSRKLRRGWKSQGTRKGRDELAEKTAITGTLILAGEPRRPLPSQGRREAVRRTPRGGRRGQRSELAQRNAANLATKLAEVARRSPRARAPRPR